MSRVISRLHRLLPASVPMALLAGCTTLGGHVSGDFACRAPEGTCAPTSVIDGRATGHLATAASGAAVPQAHRSQVRTEPGDLARTGERKLRIVFPAHIDAAGIFREESVAWAIAEPSDWAARMRSVQGELPLRAIARTISERLKAAQGAAPGTIAESSLETATSSLEEPDPILPLASPLTLPSTAREAIAGAHAPAVEGFDTPPPRARTPRSLSDQPLTFPSVEAIEAARVRGADKAVAVESRP